MDNDLILKTLIGEGKDDTIHSVGILVFFRNKMLTTQRKSGTWSIPKGRIKAVSYTHLTLPTILLV